MIGTGLGAPVGGAATNYANTGTQAAAPAAGNFNFGSTLNSNLWLDAVGKILEGTGELMQGAAGGTPTNTTGTGSLGNGGYTPLANQPQTGGLTGLTQNMGNAGTGGDLSAIMSKLNDLVNQLQGMLGQVGQQQPQAQAQAPAPAPAPQPQVDPVANLVNQANVDPQLRNAVTQVAQDPVGNKLLQGAVNDGLQGIQVANLPAGFFGQTIPEQKVVQIAPQTIQGNDLVRTVAHELTHAATLGNGDSLNEENIADRLGTQVQQRQTGFGPGYVLGGDAYKGLQQDNGIANALKLLGITV
jgi:hypothetical protein